MIAPAQALTVLAKDLEPGERVIYAVRPDMWVTIRNKILLWWIGVPWCVAIFGLFFAGRTSWAVVLPFGLAGLAMTVAPILLAIETRSTLYAITDRRALIVRSGFRPGTVSCPFQRMDDQPEIMTADGRSGHLYFASNMPRMRGVDYTGKLAFRDLADVNEVAEQLDAARKDRR